MSSNKNPVTSANVTGSTIVLQVSILKDIVAHLLSGKRRTRDTQKGVKDGKPTYGCSTNCFARASYALAGV